MHHAKNLAALSDQSQPLGPGDEGGRRGVHQCEPDSPVARGSALLLALSVAKAASGSDEAVLTGLPAGGAFFAAGVVD